MVRSHTSPVIVAACLRSLAFLLPALAVAGARAGAPQTRLHRVPVTGRARRVGYVTSPAWNTADYIWLDSRHILAVVGAKEPPAEVIRIDLDTGARHVLRVLSTRQRPYVVPWLACNDAAIDGRGRWLLARAGGFALGGRQGPLYGCISLTDSRIVTWPARGSTVGLAWCGRSRWVAVERDERGNNRAVYGDLAAPMKTRSFALRGVPGWLLQTDAEGHLVVFPWRYQSEFPQLEYYPPTGGYPWKTLSLPVHVTQRAVTGALEEIELDRTGGRALLAVFGRRLFGVGPSLREHFGPNVEVWFGRVGRRLRRVARIPPSALRDGHLPVIFRFRADGKAASFLYAGGLWVLPLPG